MLKCTQIIESWNLQGEMAFAPLPFTIMGTLALKIHYLSIFLNLPLIGYANSYSLPVFMKSCPVCWKCSSLNLRPNLHIIFIPLHNHLETCRIMISVPKCWITETSTSCPASFPEIISSRAFCPVWQSTYWPKYSSGCTSQTPLYQSPLHETRSLNLW